jgi:hypothetical protein
MSAEGTALANLFPKGPKAAVRRRIVDLVRSLAEASEDGDEADIRDR